MKKILGIGLALLLAVQTVACGYEIELTTGIANDVVYKIEDAEISEKEYLVYLHTLAGEYAAIYGTELWNLVDEQGILLEQRIMDLVAAELSQIKVMNLLAKDYDIQIEEELQKEMELAAELFIESLTEEEKEFFDIKKEDIIKMYEERYIAQTLYQTIIEDISPEISDDEARIITVQHILFRTEDLSEQQREEAFDLASSVRTMALEGESFESLISKYSEDVVDSYSFGRGEMDEVFETAAFLLAEGEISEVVISSHGYHIIKSISTFEKEETDANKEVILQAKKEEAFEVIYDEYVLGLSTISNDKLMEEILSESLDNVNGTDFLNIYEEKLALY